MDGRYIMTSARNPDTARYNEAFVLPRNSMMDGYAYLWLKYCLRESSFVGYPCRRESCAYRPWERTLRPID